MIRLKVEINIRAFERVKKRAPKELKMQIGDALDRISKGFLKRFRKWQLQGPPGVRGASGYGLFGTFKRAFLVSQEIEGMGVHIFSDSKVASLHEKGGIVKDPGGGRLAVPLSSRTQMFTRRGKLKRRYKGPRLLKSVHPMRFHGKTFLAKVTKRTGKILPLYVLKREVRLKPRLGFYRTWDSLVNYRINILNNAVDKALRKI